MTKIRRCTGNGMSECKRCKSLGKFSFCFDTWFYKVEGRDGRYCFDCVKEITRGDFEIEK